MATKKNEKNISKKDISNTSAKETFRNKIIRYYGMNGLVLLQVLYCSFFPYF